jgi:hypothetical protein
LAGVLLPVYNCVLEPGIWLGTVGDAVRVAAIARAQLQTAHCDKNPAKTTPQHLNMPALSLVGADRSTARPLPTPLIMTYVTYCCPTVGAVRTQRVHQLFLKRHICNMLLMCVSMLLPT